MRISHIKIRNILGIQDLEFSPEGFNAITGPNGTGKTSILSAIKSATGQGHDATLLRKGEEKGEVVLVLDDGTEIHERVTAGRTTRDVVKDGKKVTKPGDTIKALTDALSVNPVEFLRAESKQRVKILLESMPIQLDLEHLSEISGVSVSDEGSNPLALIDAVRKQVYDERTGTNRAVKEKDATINQLTLAMPEAPGGVEGSEDDLQARVEAATKERDTTLGKISAKLTGIQTDATEKINAIRTKLQADIDALKAAAQTEVEAIQADRSDNEQRAAAAREKAHTKWSEATTPLNQALAVIRANRDAAARREQALKTVEQMREDLEALEQDAKKQTEALDAIDAYKAQLLSSLPIPGLAVEDGEVVLDGVAFDRLNTAKQVEVAFQIAKLRAGELAVCCLDGLELLDSERLAELEAQAKDSGLQVFITRVSDDDFAVRAK